jgi:hypothetical protein
VLERLGEKFTLFEYRDPLFGMHYIYKISEREITQIAKLNPAQLTDYQHRDGLLRKIFVVLDPSTPSVSYLLSIAKTDYHTVQQILVKLEWPTELEFSHEKQYTISLLREEHEYGRCRMSAQGNCMKFL